MATSGDFNLAIDTAQAALSYVYLLRQANGDGLSPPLEQQRLTAQSSTLTDSDSAYCGHDVIAAARRGGARFSITARMNSTVVKAISGIAESAWVPIHYPNAIWAEDEQRLVSDAEVAEVPFSAFTSRRQSDHISARLIVRRVRRLNPKTVADGQGELFPGYRHHGVFTDSPLTMLQADKSHRAHAIVEQVIADLKASALAQLPSGSFSANGAWLVLAAIAFNLTVPPAPSRRSSTPKPPPQPSAGS